MKGRHRTLIVDGNSLFKNSFEGSKKTPMFDSNINGIYTFLLRIRIELENNSYNLLRIAFDGKRSGELRKNLYSDYKISRKIRRENRVLTEAEEIEQERYKFQFNRLKEYLNHFCFWSEDVVVEADDVISLYVKQAQPNEKITIMTGDVDIMQLLDKNIEVVYLNKQFKKKTRVVERYEKDPNRKVLTFTHKNFKKFFGFPPSNIVLIKTICGDDSDDIKNIKSVRETSLFKYFPEITEKKVELQEVLDKCKEMLSSEDKAKTPKKIAKHILEGVTDGKQGKDILKINQRLVDLSSDEFLTESCETNLQKNGFLSKEKFTSNDAHGLLKKMQQDGIYKQIQTNFKSLKRFFKPFKKTMK